MSQYSCTHAEYSFSLPYIYQYNKELMQKVCNLWVALKIWCATVYGFQRVIFADNSQEIANVNYLILESRKTHFIPAAILPRCVEVASDAVKPEML